MTFLSDGHEERPFLSKVVRRLGEGAGRLRREGQLGTLAALLPLATCPCARPMPADGPSMAVAPSPKSEGARMTLVRLVLVIGWDQECGWGVYAVERDEGKGLYIGSGGSVCGC